MHLSMKKCAVHAALLACAGIANAAVTEVEGSAGGGLSPWALLHPDAVGSYTHVSVQNYTLNTLTAGATFGGQVEASLSRTTADAPAVGAALSLDSRLTMSTLGLKVKLVGMDKDGPMPQISLGVQHKQTTGAILDALVAGGVVKAKSGTDLYVAATKLTNIGGKKVVANATLRLSNANTLGLMGYGGDDKNSNTIKPEVSLGVFATDNVVLGAEVRAKPNNIKSSNFGIQEGTAYDIFMAYFVNKNMAITMAYANLGQVGPSQSAVSTMSRKQDGFYVQAQVNF